MSDPLTATRTRPTFGPFKSRLDRTATEISARRNTDKKDGTAVVGHSSPAPIAVLVRFTAAANLIGGFCVTSSHRCVRAWTRIGTDISVFLPAE
jgi:hypothetical protein